MIRLHVCVRESSARLLSCQLIIEPAPVAAQEDGRGLARAPIRRPLINHVAPGACSFARARSRMWAAYSNESILFCWCAKVVRFSVGATAWGDGGGTCYVEPASQPSGEQKHSKQSPLPFALVNSQKFQRFEEICRSLSLAGRQLHHVDLLGPVPVPGPWLEFRGEPTTTDNAAPLSSCGPRPLVCVLCRVASHKSRSSHH